MNPLKIQVITVSDRASRGVYEDLSGPAVKAVIGEVLPDAAVLVSVVPDEMDALADAFDAAAAFDVILTNGGTGIGPRDITPQATRLWVEHELPGIAEMLRLESRVQTQSAVLSRGVAGVRGKTIVVNLPGSPRGAAFCAKLVAPLLVHALRMLSGEGH